MIIQHHHYYFILYSFCYLIYAIHIISLGALIPYLSAQSHYKQTEYSILFFCRSMGMLTGAIFIKIIESYKVKNWYHEILMASIVIIFVFSLFFTYTVSIFPLAIQVFVIGISYSAFQILINTCTLMIGPKKQQQFWMLLVHGSFGIGGLIGPFFVYLFQIKSYMICSLIFIALLPFLYKLKNPEDVQHQQINQQNVQTQLIVPKNVQYLLCLAIFIQVGIQLTFTGWISSFSVISEVNDKQKATVYPTIFWTMITIFRFVFAFLSYSSHQKLKFLTLSLVITGLINLILVQFNYLQALCYFSSIFFGIFSSSVYPLFFLINSQFGYQISSTQSNNIASCGVLGQGFLTMFIGFLMDFIHIDYLFHGMLALCLMNYAIRGICVNIYQKNGIKNVKEVEIQLIQKSNNNLQIKK